jgi:hypothetical protein
MELAHPRGSSDPTVKPTKLAAIMFADMVNYSKHIEQDEATNANNAARSIELF